MCKYYGYCRVSTETQSEKGYGLQAQRQELKKYAATAGIEYEHIYEDAGISGNLKDTDEDEAINKREALIEMLSCLKPGDKVVVLNTARLWRSDMTKVIIRRDLMKHQADVISIENQKYSLYNKDPSDRLITSMMQLLDEYDRATISLKLARGRTVKAKNGDKPAGVCPFGYQYSADKKRVEINKEEAAVIKMMFTEGQKGRSLHQIADYLNKQGIVSRRGKQWSGGSIQMILRNPFYTGVLMHQGKPIKGNHEPIISKVQFGKVQAQLASRKRG